MKVKVIDEQHEIDLEEAINSFLTKQEIKIIDIKFATSCFFDGEEQIFCFSVLILYE